MMVNENDILTYFDRTTVNCKFGHLPTTTVQTKCEKKDHKLWENSIFVNTIGDEYEFETNLFCYIERESKASPCYYVVLLKF